MTGVQMSTGEHAAVPEIVDLRERVAGHSLIEKLLAEWDAGRIRVEANEVVIDDECLGWYWGVFGERRTAANLAYLGPEWTVLHSVPIGTSGKDIDHVVVGPPGAFAINTKDHRGKSIWSAGYGVSINGSQRPGYIKSILSDTERTEAVLSRASGLTVPTRGAISFVSPRAIRITDQPGTPDRPIIITSDELLTSKLRSYRRELSDEQIAHIASVASSPFTWLRTSPRSRPGAALNHEFDALAAELGALLERRRGAGGIRRPELKSTYPAASRTSNARTTSVPTAAPLSRRPTATKRRGKRTGLERLAGVILIAGFIALLYWLTTSGILSKIFVAFFSGLAPH